MTWKIHINDKTILHFINIWSREAIGNIIYPITVNNIDRYLDSMISPTSVRYIMSIDKGINTKKRRK